MSTVSEFMPRMMSRLSPVKMVRFVQLGEGMALLDLVVFDEYYAKLICFR